MRTTNDQPRNGKDKVHWSMSCASASAGGEGSLAATIPTVEEIADVLHERDKQERYTALHGGAAIE